MQSICEYIKESLLDDFSDLEKSSDRVVSKNQTIGMKYELDSIYINPSANKILNLFDKKKLKEYCKKLYWSDIEPAVYNERGILNRISNKSRLDIISYLCNIILSISRTALDSDYNIINISDNFSGLYKNNNTGIMVQLQNKDDIIQCLFYDIYTSSNFTVDLIKKQ